MSEATFIDTLPDGRVGTSTNGQIFRFPRNRPYNGKLWSGQYYRTQPGYVCYTLLDIKHIWRKHNERKQNVKA